MAFSEVSLGGAALVDANQMVRNIRQQAATSICEKIEDIVLKNHVRRIASFKSELETLTAELDVYGVDSSLIKAKVKALMTSATEYNSTRLACSRKVSLEVRSQHLAAADSEIAEASSIRQDDFNHRQSALESLEKLKKEQQNLEAQVAVLDERLSLHDKKIADLEKKKTQIKETPELTTDEFKAVKSLQDVFEAQRNSFKGLTWA